jgi:DnaK suppressor protein
MALKKEFIAEQKRRLLETKAELESELKDLEGVPDMGSDVDSFEEEADEAEEYVTNLSKSDALGKDLDYVKHALKRIDSGTYGICSGCNTEISQELLLVAPESTFCKECKLKSPYRKAK